MIDLAKTSDGDLAALGEQVRAEVARRSRSSDAKAAAVAAVAAFADAAGITVVEAWRVIVPDGAIAAPPAPDVPEWKQPDAATTYKKGDLVRFEGATYRSLIHTNAWSPSAYPQGWEKVS